MRNDLTNNGNFNELLSDAFRQIEYMNSKSTKISGVESGLVDLDRITNGWQPGELYIIAGRPSMGKTSLALSTAYNTVVQFNKPVAFITLESTSDRIVKRLISMGCEIPSDKLIKGNLETNEWQKLVSNSKKLSEANFIIDDSHTLSMTSLRMKAIELREKFSIQALIIDYIQLLSSEKDNRYSNREQEISFISRSLKSLAKEIRIPIIAISQLSRNVENRGGSKRPQLADLRDSGALEDDADMVLFIYRPEYYGMEYDEDNQPTKGLAELNISKNRNGSLDSVRLRFIENLGKFVEFDANEFESTFGNSRIIVGSRMTEMEENSDSPF